MRKIGRYNVNEALTAKLAIEGWVIYRDPAVGLYCSPVDGVDGEEFMTGYYSAVQIKNTMSEFISDCRTTILTQNNDWDEVEDEEIDLEAIMDTRTKREIAVALVRHELINAVMGNSFTEYPTYAEFIEYAYDGDSSRFKDDVYTTLLNYSNAHPILGQWYTDDLELIEADGSLVSYRSWSHDIRAMFDEYYNITFTIATAVQPSNSDLDFFDFFDKVSGALFEASEQTGLSITDPATYSLYLKNVGWGYCDPVVNGDGTPFTVHDYVETLNTAIVTTTKGLALIKDGKLIHQALVDAPTGICYCHDWDC